MGARQQGARLVAPLCTRQPSLQQQSPCLKVGGQLVALTRRHEGLMGTGKLPQVQPHMAQVQMHHGQPRRVAGLQFGHSHIGGLQGLAIVTQGACALHLQHGAKAHRAAAHFIGGDHALRLFNVALRLRHITRRQAAHGVVGQQRDLLRQVAARSRVGDGQVALMAGFVGAAQVVQHHGKVVVQLGLFGLAQHGLPRGGIGQQDLKVRQCVVKTPGHAQGGGQALANDALQAHTAFVRAQVVRQGQGLFAMLNGSVHVGQLHAVPGALAQCVAALRGGLRQMVQAIEQRKTTGLADAVHVRVDGPGNALKGLCQVARHFGDVGCAQQEVDAFALAQRSVRAVGRSVQGRQGAFTLASGFPMRCDARGFALSSLHKHRYLLVQVAGNDVRQARHHGFKNQVMRKVGAHQQLLLFELAPGVGQLQGVLAEHMDGQGQRKIHTGNCSQARQHQGRR